MVQNIMVDLIHVSEKAANIARVFRQNENLLNLLTEEKSEAEANPRFVKDYKTLADVLIQETIRHEIGKLYPLVRDNIHGEETATFTNALGESIDLEIFDDPAKTAECLLKVLDGDIDAADALAAEVHQNVLAQGAVENIPDLPEIMDLSAVGILIDPIDATEEYVKGTLEDHLTHIPGSGLQCVTILIGLYDKGNGKPIGGIINQPFQKLTDTGYRGSIYWGINMDEVKATNLPVLEPKTTKLAVVSSSEDEKYTKALKDLGYTIVFSAGVGHKILKVISGEADLYLLSRNTSFKWDTCGPHAILNAIDGGLFKIEDIIESGSVVEVDYNDERPNANDGGLLALRRDEVHILQDLYNKK